MSSLIVGGVLPLTTIDYPDHLAAVVFCQGCAWRCRYCHNPELLPRKTDNAVAWSEVIDFLKRRKNKLDAVVFSGGEPTLQPVIIDAVKEVKALGFKVGLHSSGIVPEVLTGLLPLIDWIGLDVKALPDNYAAVTGNRYSGRDAWDSVQCVIDSGVAHQMRVTVHPKLHSEQHKAEILRRLDDMGAQEVIVQQVRTQLMLDPTL